jgi:hypothetical protein
MDGPEHVHRRSAGEQLVDLANSPGRLSILARNSNQQRNAEDARMQTLLYRSLWVGIATPQRFDQ